MKIWKIQNGHKSNEFVMISEKSCTRLLVKNIDNYDFSFSIGNGIILKKDVNDVRNFKISKTDKDAYEIFDKLYNSLLSLKNENKELFDEDNNFIWFSSGEEYKVADYLIISHNLDCYKLSFVRNNSYKELEQKEKTIRSININVFSSNSKTDDIVKCFDEMYKGLSKIGVTELLFTRKGDKNE